MQHQSLLYLKFDRKDYFSGFSPQLNNLLILFLFIKVNFFSGIVRNHMLIKSHLWMNGSQAICPTSYFKTHTCFSWPTKKEKEKKKPPVPQPDMRVILYRTRIQAIRKISKITQVWLFSGFRFLLSVRVSKFYQLLSDKFWQEVNFSSSLNIFNFPKYLIMKVSPSTSKSSP